MFRKKTAAENAADREEHRYALDDLQDAVDQSVSGHDAASRANLRRARLRERRAREEMDREDSR